MEKKGTNFDWVTAIATCSVTSAFVRLRVEVEQDVKKMHELTKGAHYGFRFQNNNDSNFCAVVEGNNISRSVCFELQQSENQIQVHRGAEIVKVKMTIDDEGECRFQSPTGEKLDFWQFRKRMLEDLFFFRPEGQ